MNTLPEGTDPDSKVTVGSLGQNGKSCEEGGKRAKDGALLNCHKKVEAAWGETPGWSLSSVVTR